ncbi:hypothetical protein MED193_06129 [Roseobacter sp. MED193]|nr:hypothetical protein MED193_06129 [Roseobacter sp. MED193]
MRDSQRATAFAVPETSPLGLDLLEMAVDLPPPHSRVLAEIQPISFQPCESIGSGL